MASRLRKTSFAHGVKVHVTQTYVVLTSRTVLQGMIPRLLPPKLKTYMTQEYETANARFPASPDALDDLNEWVSSSGKCVSKRCLSLGAPFGGRSPNFEQSPLVDTGLSDDKRAYKRNTNARKKG